MRVRSMRILDQRFLGFALCAVRIRQVIKRNTEIYPADQEIRFDLQRAGERFHRVLSFVLFEQGDANVVGAISGFAFLKC